MPKLTVAILNYNGRRHLENYLPSLLLYTPSDKADIIVIDNASTDDSLEWLQRYKDRISVISLDKNYGFAEGYNRGLTFVHTPYYLLLNSDVRVTENWIDPLLSLMEGDEHIGACQPKMLSDIDRERFDYSGGLGGYIDCLGFPFAIGRIFKSCEKDSHQYDIPQKISWACGAALLVRADAYKRAGGMDHFFFAHQEEIDLCLRLSSLGYTIWNCPSSTVYHLGAGTLPQRSPFKLYLNVRNNLILMYKNFPFRYFLVILLFRLIIDNAFSAAELCKGNGRMFLAVFRAYLSFWIWLLAKKNTRPSPQKQLPPNGFYRHTIIWDYYVRRKRKFSQLRFNSK